MQRWAHAVRFSNALNGYFRKQTFGPAADGGSSTKQLSGDAYGSWSTAEPSITTAVALADADAKETTSASMGHVLMMTERHMYLAIYQI